LPFTPPKNPKSTTDDGATAFSFCLRFSRLVTGGMEVQGISITVVDTAPGSLGTPMEKIFPMGKAGFIEMHMGIYRPGKRRRPRASRTSRPAETCFGV
jgi:hypothetical protein